MVIFSFTVLCYSVWGCTTYSAEAISYASMNDTGNAQGFLFATVLHFIALAIASVALGRGVSNLRA
jgi:hypothetical protein